ncbi:MAG: prolipoprotein diacylglyceryl transferase [Ruminococcaceae bacterium]|nr:prolipoprotein diacylglyceryl transferase [Oscillospiraceae bacterium]
MTTISFPGLGIPEFTINPIAIPFGEGGIRWYALLIVTGMIFAVIYAQYRAKSEGINFDTIIDFAIFTIPIGIIGARLFYVFFDWIDVMVNNKPNPYQSFVDVIAIWEGGLAIYGGIIFGTITIFAVAKAKKMTWSRLFKVLDAIAPGVMIAQAIGRWGNFCNGEAYGTPTSLPWRMCSDKFAHRLYNLDFIDLETKQQMLNGTLGVHPTFLYESLWNILGFILINIFYKKKRFDGQIMLMYFSWYGFGRMFIELLRTDSLTNGNSLRVSSLIGLLSFVIAGSLLLYLFIRNKGKKAFASDVINAAEDTETEDTVKSESEEISKSEEKIETNSPPSDLEIQNQETKESNEEENDGKID